MKTRIGFFITILGAMTGDSNSLLVPATIIAIGAALFIAGQIEGEEDAR